MHWNNAATDLKVLPDISRDISFARVLKSAAITFSCLVAFPGRVYVSIIAGS